MHMRVAVAVAFGKVAVSQQELQRITEQCPLFLRA